MAQTGKDAAAAALVHYFTSQKKGQERGVTAERRQRLSNGVRV